MSASCMYDWEVFLLRKTVNTNKLSTFDADLRCCEVLQALTLPFSFHRFWPLHFPLHVSASSAVCALHLILFARAFPFSPSAAEQQRGRGRHSEQYIPALIIFLRPTHQRWAQPFSSSLSRNRGISPSSHHSPSLLPSRHLLPPPPPPRPLPLPPHHLTPAPLAVLQARRSPRQRPRFPVQGHVLHAVHPAVFDPAPSAR